MKKLLIGLLALGSISSFAQDLDTTTTTVELLDYHSRDVIVDSTTPEGRTDIATIFEDQEKLQMCADHITKLNEIKDSRTFETLEMIEKYAAGKEISEYTKWLIEKETSNLKAKAKVQIYVLRTINVIEDYFGIESYLRVGEHSKYLGKANFGCKSLVSSFDLKLNTIYSLIADSVDRDLLEYNLPEGIN